MRRSPWLVPSLALLAAACAPVSEPASDPVADRATTPQGRAPNVVLFVSDDQGRFVGSYGHPSLTTPHLDRMAAEGLRFDNAYTTTAVCLPSRAVLYTGRFPAGNGCDGFEPIGEGVPIWSDLLSAAGYRTGLIGKIGVKPEERFRFDFLAPSRTKDPWGRLVSWYVEQLEAFLAQADARPFCLVVSLRDPHYPFPDDGAPTGTRAEPEPPHDPAAVGIPGFLVDLPDVRVELARFHDALRRLDATVGAMIDVLDARIRPEELLLLHTTDHGAPFPFAKTTLYEAGIRVSLIARWRGTIGPGRATPALVSLADVLPTLLELAGVAAPPGLDGRSLAPLLRGETDEHRSAVFGSHTRHRVPPDLPCRSVRRGDWKYIRNFQGEGTFRNAVMFTSPSWRAILEAAATDPLLAERVTRLENRPLEELFDLAHDPHELVNLAEEPQHAQTLADLRQEVLAFMRAQGDTLLGAW